MSKRKVNFRLDPEAFSIAIKDLVLKANKMAEKNYTQLEDFEIVLPDKICGINIKLYNPFSYED